MTAQAVSELKPCPFCGGPPRVAHPRLPLLYGCASHECSAQHLKMEAAEWNARPKPAEDNVALVERLREALQNPTLGIKKMDTVYDVIEEAIAVLSKERTDER